MYYLCQSSSKALKVKEATFLLMLEKYQCFKDNPLPVYELVLHANCTVAHILEPQTFFKLTLSWIWTARLEGIQASKKPIPIQTQSFESQFRSSWLGVCRPCKGSPRRIKIFKRNNPKQFVIPSHSAAHSHIITAVFTIKSRARHCSKHGFIAF